MFGRNKNGRVEFKDVKTVNEGINIVRTTKGAYLLDIRSKEAYQEKHVGGAVNIPADRLDLIGHRIPDKSAVIYIYGSYQIKPKKTKHALQKLGYINVHVCGYIEEHKVSPL